MKSKRMTMLGILGLLMVIVVLADAQQNDWAMKDVEAHYAHMEQSRARMDRWVGALTQSSRFSLNRFNGYLNKERDAIVALQASREDFTRVCLITLLTVLLLSWLVTVRMTGDFEEALLTANQQLSKHTRELDELTQNLEREVQERTSGLQKTQAQLLQSEKFAAIGQLAAGIAHEINNPIGFINSNLQTLGNYLAHYTRLLGILNKLEKYLKDEDQERVAHLVGSWQKIRTETNFAFIGDDIGKLIQESQEGVERIHRIVLDLKTLAGGDRGVVEAVNVEALMDSMVNIVWNEIKYKAELKKSYMQVPLVTCNPQKICQVFINLLMNACQSIEKKGVVAIRTYIKSGYVCVDVSDNGQGIAPEHTAKIFAPFFTTKPVGRGLGLSLSYDIVHKHGGDMAFESRYGQGTTFTVMLPAQEVPKAVGL